MMKLVFRQLKTHFQRTLAIVVAIVLGVAFFSASMMSGNVIEQAIRGEVGNQLRGADLVATTEMGGLEPDLVSALGAVSGVQATEPVYTTYGTSTVGGTTSILRMGELSSVPAILDQMPIAEGRLPDASGQIALTEGAATRLGVEPGDSIHFTAFDGGDGQAYEFRIVGLIAGGNAFGTNITEAFVTPATFAIISLDPYLNAIVIQVADGESIPDVQERASAVVPFGVEVLTFDQLVDAEVASMEQGSNALTYGLVAFSLIALFVAGIVISNTFAITLTQRTHELAMLRCIGAEKRQIQRSVIAEAALLGAGSSIAGFLLGYGIVSVGARVFFEDAGGLGLFELSPWAVILPIAVGTVVTLVSASVPARKATAVHPLQALRQTDAPIESVSFGLARLVVSTALIGGGALLLFGGMYLSLSLENEAPFGPLLIGMAGGGASFLGLLVASALIVPSGMRAAGWMGEMVRGVPARIPTSNAMRNPRRTASTSAALMMGVTLISMMTVGAASVQATFNDVIDQQAPIDLNIRPSLDAPNTPLPMGIYNGFASVDGVRQVMPIHGLDAQISVSGQEMGVTAVAVDPQELRSVARSSDIAAGFDKGTMLVPAGMAESYGLVDGDRVALMRDGRTVDFSVKVVKLSDWEVYVTLDDADKLSNTLPVTGAWIRLDDGAAVKEVVRDISNGIPPGESVSIDGGASDRATYLELVDQMLMITTALLGVAVIIAIVGVGNTLTLSVLERTRESGMLRAMGLTGSQLRESLAIEGALIAFIGGLIGILAGTIYGWIGAITLFGSSWEVSLGFPAGRVLLIMAIAILAGVLASVLPGRRAASISPVEALATVQVA